MVVRVEIFLVEWPSPHGLVDIEEELPGASRCDVDVECCGFGILVGLQNHFVIARRPDPRNDLEWFDGEVPLQRPFEYRKERFR